MKLRKVILQMYISLDGYVAGPKGEMDWIFSNEEANDYAPMLLESSDLILIGRGMSKEFMDYWPNDKSEFGAKINATPKLIFSKTVKESQWHDARMISDPETEIKKQKALPGKNMILYGGARLAGSFSKLDLIDEYHIMIAPVILGEGLHLFKDVTRVDLELIKTRKAGGVVINHYEPKK